MHYPEHLKKTIEYFRKFPGVGPKSAERFAFQLLNWSSDEIRQFSAILGDVPLRVVYCEECGALSEVGEECRFCDEERRSGNLICVVASPRDLLAIEETGQFRGFYHVVSGTISPLEGRGPEIVRFDELKGRIEKLGIEEVIIALDATLEGDATALWLKEQLEGLGTRVSRLAFGVPMGSALDYVDGGTLGQALVGRTRF